MNDKPASQEPRGYQDLMLLWEPLPLAALHFQLSAPPDLIALSEALRGAVWRQHCASELFVCVERGEHCRFASQNNCRADRLIPCYLGGGAPSWRMATLYLHWQPDPQRLMVLGLGRNASADLEWTAQWLRDHYGLITESMHWPVSRWADFRLPENKRWHLRFITPWLVQKHGPRVKHSPQNPTPNHLAAELIDSMKRRALKLTALCVQDAMMQRLAGHLAYHIANALLLPEHLRVESAALTARRLQEASKGNNNRFSGVSWHGEAVLQVNPLILPWLTLLMLCGGGQNADKGYGRLALLPLPN